MYIIHASKKNLIVARLCSMPSCRLLIDETQPFHSNSIFQNTTDNVSILVVKGDSI